ASMLDYWEGEARADSITEEVIQAVVARLRSYEKLSPEGRAESLKGLWKRIGETYPEANQKPKEQTKSPQVDQVQRQERRDVVAKGEPKQQNQNPVKQNQTPPKQRQNPIPRSQSVAGAKHSQTPPAFDSKLTVLQGVGPKNAESLAKLGMQTLGDMLYNYPRRY